MLCSEEQSFHVFHLFRIKFTPSNTTQLSIRSHETKAITCERLPFSKTSYFIHYFPTKYLLFSLQLTPNSSRLGVRRHIWPRYASLALLLRSCTTEYMGDNTFEFKMILGAEHKGNEEGLGPAARREGSELKPSPLGERAFKLLNKRMKAGGDKNDH